MAHECEGAGEAAAVLYQRGGRWGLPSADPFCLKAQVYCRMAGLELEVVDCNNAGMSPRGVLPVLQTGSSWTAEEDLLDALETQCARPLDGHLSEEQRAEAFAFERLVEGPLHAAALHAAWAEPANFASVTRPAEADALPFPLGHFLPRLQQHAVAARLHAAGLHDAAAARAAADACYRALAARLGAKPFFFGPRPSRLDAVVFGHLAVHYFAPMPAHGLRDLIAQHRNLQAYVTRLAGEYFEAVPSIKAAEADVSKDSREVTETMQRLAVVAAFGILGLFVVRQIRVGTLTV
mmetsp:Transcript_635/g.2243  ORF Transcript_635/g.2243 Transcript_635/m.2243 type:complete len:293 (+) Transcript_635:22-900(+)